MLVVKVELWPGGDPEGAREIGRIGMANVSNLSEDSDYIFVAMNDRGDVNEGIVRHHKRSDGFWKLVQRLCSSAHRGGNKVPAYHEDTLRAVAERMQRNTTPHPLRKY